jgi:hypothetical protein
LLTVLGGGVCTSADPRRVLTIEVTDGAATRAVLSTGTLTAVVGIGRSELSANLLGVFLVGPGRSGRQPASIDPSNGVVSLLGTPGASIAGSIEGVHVNQRNGARYALVFPGAERRPADLDPHTGTVILLGATTVAGVGVPLASPGMNAD